MEEKCQQTTKSELANKVIGDKNPYIRIVKLMSFKQNDKSNSQTSNPMPHSLSFLQLAPSFNCLSEVTPFHIKK